MVWLFTHSALFFSCHLFSLFYSVYAHSVRLLSHFLVAFLHSNDRSKREIYKTDYLKWIIVHVWSCMFALSDLCVGGICTSVPKFCYEKCLMDSKSRPKTERKKNLLATTRSLLHAHNSYKTWDIEIGKSESESASAFQLPLHGNHSSACTHIESVKRVAHIDFIMNVKCNRSLQFSSSNI